jgi:hypothetical protein
MQEIQSGRATLLRNWLTVKVSPKGLARPEGEDWHEMWGKQILLAKKAPSENNRCRGKGWAQELVRCREEWRQEVCVPGWVYMLEEGGTACSWHQQ